MTGFLAACSVKPAQSTAAVPQTGRAGTATGTTPAGPKVNTDKAPAELRALATALYTGKPVSAGAGAAKALRARKATTKPVTVTGATGTWNGAGIATLTSGKDTSLLVRTSAGWNIVGGWWPSMGVPGPVLAARTHLVTIGSDARENAGASIQRSNGDSLHVIGVDGRGGGGILGIARDAYVPIAGGGSDKINAGLFRGPLVQMQTVAGVTGLPVAGYVLTGFNGFTAMINELHNVFVESVQRVLIYPKGRVGLTGQAALVFSRERHTLPGGDFDRSRNQALVLIAIAKKIRDGGPDYLPQALGVVSKHVVTNVPASTALLMGGWAYKANPARIGMAVAKGGFGRSPRGASVVLLGSEARALFARFKDGNL